MSIGKAQRLVRLRSAAPREWRCGSSVDMPVRPTLARVESMLSISKTARGRTLPSVSMASAMRRMSKLCGNNASRCASMSGLGYLLGVKNLQIGLQDDGYFLRYGYSGIFEKRFNSCTSGSGMNPSLSAKILLINQHVTLLLGDILAVFRDSNHRWL